MALKGDAYVEAPGTGGAYRYFALRTEDAAGDPADRATWEINAGSSLTLYYKTGTSGALPPGGANTVELRVYYETGTGLLVRTLHNGSPPADGTSYTFYGTDDGTVTGSPRCGQLRLYVRAIRTDIGTYDVNSDADGDQGVIRSNMLVSDLAVSAYPAGSKFAYGTSTNEQFTLTATHTQKYADRNNETFDVESTDASDVAVETSLDLEVGAGTTTAQAFTVDDTYATGDNNYGFRFRVNNNGLLLTGEPWTRPIDNGANVTQDGTTAVKRSAFYVVNPDNTFGTVTPGESVYNRGETASLTVGITNARGESLTRSMGLRIRDGNGTSKKTFNDAGPTYGDGGTSNYAIQDGDRATPDITGDPWTLEGNTAGARFTNDGIAAYAVSRLELLDTSGAATITPSAANGEVFTDKVDDPTTDGKTVFNRGQRVDLRTFVYNVRGERLGSVSRNWNVRPVGAETVDEPDKTYSLAAGEFAPFYTVDTDEATGGKTLLVATTDTTVGNQPRTGTGGSGNFAETNLSPAEWTVSDTYTVESRTQKEATRNADPEDTQFTIGEDVIYAFAEVKDAHGDPVDGAHVDLIQVNPSGSTTQSQLDVVTASSGWTPNPGAAFDSRAPKGTGWVQRATVNADAANDGNTGTNDQSISMVSAFTANKAVITGLGPALGVANTLGYDTAKKGDAAKPGDRLLAGVAFMVDGARTSPDATPVPGFLLGQFNQSTGKVEVWQPDGSWKDQDDAEYVEQFQDFKEALEPNDGEGGSGDALEWIAAIGTAAQGVTASNGYVYDTGTWNPGAIFMVVRVHKDTQPFYSGRAHPFVDATSNMNPASAQAPGHFDGVDFAAGFPRY